MPGDAIFYGPKLILVQWNFLSKPEQVGFRFDALGFAGLLRNVEVATSAGHAVRTLVEKIIRAVAVTEVIKLPRLVRWASAFDGILINENLNGPDVPGEVAGILVGLRKLCWRNLCVVTRRFGRAVTEPLL